MKTYLLEIHFKNSTLGTYMTTTEEEIKDILEHSTIETRLDGDLILINTSNVLYTRIKEIEQKKNIRKINEIKSDDTTDNK